MLSIYLINESPGHPDAFFHVFDNSIAGFQTRVVIQCGPYLRTDLLKKKVGRFNLIFCVSKDKWSGNECEISYLENQFGVL